MDEASFYGPSKDEIIPEGQFHVEVPDPSGIYAKVKNGLETGRAILDLGGTISENGLFSQITAHVIPYVDGEFFRAEIQAVYDQGQVANSYWTQEQIGAIQEQLKPHYGVDTMELRHLDAGHNILTIRDAANETKYQVLFGYEDERTRWTKGVETFHKDLEPRADVPEAIRDNWQKLGQREFGRLMKPEPVTNLDFMITLLDENGTHNEPARLGEKRDFERKITGFGQAVERIVNAGAKVKEIPQPATLTLS